MQRDYNPVERRDIAGKTLQPCVSKHPPRRLAFDCVQQWHKGNPRREAQIEFGKTEGKRQATGNGQGGASRGIRRHQAEPKSLSSGITPAHGGFPSNRSYNSSASCQFSTSATAPCAGNGKSPARRHSRSKLQSTGGSPTGSKPTTRQR